MERLIQTWTINQRMNELLVVDINDSLMKDVSANTGRNVGEQFAHIHNVRLMWLAVALPDLMNGQKKIDKEQTITKKLIFESLEKSADAITQLLKHGFET